MSVAVIGGGAFGTALAIVIAKTQCVKLWARSASHVAELKISQENNYRLPGVKFPKLLKVTSELKDVFDADIILFAIPMQALTDFVEQYNLVGKTVVACCKGIDLETGQCPSVILNNAAHTAVLTGPSFARDIALGLPAALTLACANPVALAHLQVALSTPTLRLYRTTDVVGAEIGGALKNVISIGCGAVIGAGLGESARAALMTRGFAEMVRFASVLGAQPETLMGLSGLGDLALTCTSNQSRNYQYGFAIGAGIESDKNLTVEGISTARALRNLTTKLNLDLPVCIAVADLVDNKVNINSAVDRLLARPLKEE